MNFDNPTQSSGIVNEITIPYAFNFQLWVSCLYSDYFCTNNKKYKFNVYKSDPFYQMSLNPVYYFNVRESIKNNGKTDFTFTSHFDYNDFLGTSYSLGSNKMGPYSSTKYARTKIKNIKIYKTNGLSEQVTLEKTINYKLITKNKTSILHIDPIVVSKSFGSIFLIKGLNINSGLLQNIQEIETQKFN